MLETFKIFIISTIAVTWWTAFLLLKDKKGYSLLNLWFAAFLILLTVPQFDNYLGLTFQQPSYFIYVAIHSFLWLKGPFVWGFVSILIHKKINWKTMWLHFIPWLGIFIVLWYLPQRAPTLQIFGLCQVLIYLSLTMATLSRKRKYIQHLWQGFQNTAFYWLLYIIGGLILLMTMDLFIISFVRLGFLENYSLLDFYAFPLFSVYVLSIAILNVYRPELLFRQSSKEDISNLSFSTQAPQTSNLVNAPSHELNETKERYLELDSSLAKPLLDQLAQLMQQQHLYRQNELSLMDLASSLGISLHQVSELLNVHQGTSFYEFVNRYRIQFACERLKDPSCNSRVLDIAFDAGFNNKNSFYRAFKEVTGFTPNQFRANAFELTESLNTRLNKVPH